MNWRLFGLLGFPVEHSFSPLLMNAIARRHDLPMSYHAFSIAPEQLGNFVHAVRLLPVAGFNVTAPHKRAIVAYCDEKSPAVEAIGASNCVLNRDGRLAAHNTDVAGFLWGLEQAGFSPAGKRALILGAGGAARAVAYALSRAGAASLAVASRSARRKEEWQKESPALLAAGKIQFVPWREEVLAELLRNAELVVQCTPVGTWPRSGQTVAFPFSALNEGHLVYDLVYNPPETAFLRRAGAEGARTQNGLAMLAAQAAEALRIWGFTVDEMETYRLLQELVNTAPQKTEAD